MSLNVSTSENLLLLLLLLDVLSFYIGSIEDSISGNYSYLQDVSKRERLVCFFAGATASGVGGGAFGVSVCTAVVANSAASSSLPTTWSMMSASVRATSDPSP